MGLGRLLAEVHGDRSYGGVEVLGSAGSPPCQEASAGMEMATKKAGQDDELEMGCCRAFAADLEIS